MVVWGKDCYKPARNWTRHCKKRAYGMKVPTVLLELSPEWPDMVSQGEEKTGTAK